MRTLRSHCIKSTCRPLAAEKSLKTIWHLIFSYSQLQARKNTGSGRVGLDWSPPLSPRIIELPVTFTWFLIPLRQILDSTTDIFPSKRDARSCYQIPVSSLIRLAPSDETLAKNDLGYTVEVPMRRRVGVTTPVTFSRRNFWNTLSLFRRWTRWLEASGVVIWSSCAWNRLIVLRLLLLSMNFTAKKPMEMPSRKKGQILLLLLSAIKQGVWSFGSNTKSMNVCCTVLLLPW